MCTLIAYKMRSKDIIQTDFSLEPKTHERSKFKYKMKNNSFFISFYFGSTICHRQRAIAVSEGAIRPPRRKPRATAVRRVRIRHNVFAK